MKTLPVNLRDGLQLWIDGSNNGSTTYYDVSGAGLTGTSTSVTNGRRLQHKSMGFNGSSSKINFGDVLDFEINQPFSLSTRIKTTTTGFIVIISKQNQSTGLGYSVFVDNGNKFLVQIRPTGGGASIVSSVNIQDGNWKHLVFTYSGNSNISGTNLYINGTLDTGVTRAGGALSGTMLTTDPFVIGARGTGALFFNGNLTNCMVWNRELTATEIQQLHKSQFIK